jgi:hypothetical protein
LKKEKIRKGRGPNQPEAVLGEVQRGSALLLKIF